MTRWIAAIATAGLVGGGAGGAVAAPKPPLVKTKPGKGLPVKPSPSKPAPLKPALPPADAPPDPVVAAKKVFSERLCASCHTVQSAGISRQPPPPGPDLSHVGKTMDAAALDGWLRKGEQRGGKPHAVRFLGSDAEWQTLVDWLVTLK